MVCLGNICRSPLAEGIAQHLADQRGLDWHFDSAGTSGWHDGKPPDSRSIEVATAHGIDIAQQQSRKLIENDFEFFDFIIPMDAENLRDVRQLAPDGSKAQIRMMMDFLHPRRDGRVPDPYYGGKEGFREVYNLLLQSCEAMLNELTS